MSFVYVLQGKRGYEARLKDNREGYEFDIQMARRLRERLVHAFEDIPQSVAPKSFSLASDFANAHNSGQNPSLAGLEVRVHRLIAEDSR